MQAEFNTEQIATLGSWRLWRQISRNRILDEASSEVRVEEAELKSAWGEFCERNGLLPESPQATPPELAGTPVENLELVVARDFRIAKWKEEVFGPQAEDHFAKRKPDLDRVVYSLLRLESTGLARELWFRLNEGEATFAELAGKYSAGEEIYTAGIVGPVTMGSIHPVLSSVLRSAHPGRLLQPFQVAEWYVVARLEHHLPAEFDANMRRRMIEELAAHWLDQQTHATRGA